MSRPLYDRCSICDGTGRWPADKRLCVDGPELQALAEAGTCPGCQGQKFVETGLTAGQVERAIRERDELRSLVRRAVGDRIDDGWLVEARRMLRSLAAAGQSPRTVKPGTVHNVLRKRDVVALVFFADGEPDEPYLLLGQTRLERAKRGERGSITFETGGPMGGWWRYSPGIPTVPEGGGE
jgi:hypothetical protein